MLLFVGSAFINYIDYVYISWYSICMISDYPHSVCAKPPSSDDRLSRESVALPTYSSACQQLNSGNLTVQLAACVDWNYVPRLTEGIMLWWKSTCLCLRIHNILCLFGICNYQPSSRKYHVFRKHLILRQVSTIISIYTIIWYIDRSLAILNIVIYSSKTCSKIYDNQ